MEWVGALGDWITEHESLLSGSAAIIALLSVAASAMALLFKRVAQGNVAVQDAAATASKGHSLTLSDLTAPAPYPIQYTESDGLRIAYAQTGGGPHAMMLAPGIISHLNIVSHLPPMRDTIDALGEFAYIVLFDKRGQGLSDPCLEMPGMTERVHDIEAVLDASGQERVVLYGLSEGGPMCVQFAVEHPERVKGLILLGTTARWLQGPDFPAGMSERWMDTLATTWGTGMSRKIFFPGISREIISDETYRAFENLTATRSSVKQLVNYMKQVDIRDLLPRLTCPTLVLHFAGDLAIPVRLGRALADAIPNAEFLELAGTDHADLSASPEGVARIRRFVENLSGR